MHDDPREEFPSLATIERVSGRRPRWWHTRARQAHHRRLFLDLNAALDELDAHRAGAADWASAMMALTYAHDLLDELSADEDLSQYRRNQCRVAAREVKDAVLP